MVPIGCGASDEYAAAPRQGSGLALPPRTVQALQACVKEGGQRLRHNAYEIEFAVELTGDRVTAVKPKGPRLDDTGVQQCMIEALRRMADAGFSPDPDELVSRGGLLPTRGMLANTWALPQVIRLIPVVVGSGGTMIVVAVAVLVVVAAVSLKDDRPSKEECKKIKQMCIEECADTVLPRGDDGSAFRLCQQECLERHGCPRHS
ncbi:hypothetical protein [Polyangium mundeleinium]|uniref:Uncharacterized protein n=1 Tax=Polyangium mundeleinium TaxID=2995306 RepID=A0ABT5EGA1_9BACT|nr:hypothetical protein [Polyangium mundeleinium]MDC0739917.1 hypothetical protein [Polyangium mundeleinium]